jgi:hypothetical protein
VHDGTIDLEEFDVGHGRSSLLSVKARSVLGWQPHRPGLLEDVERGSYAAAA